MNEEIARMLQWITSFSFYILTRNFFVSHFVHFQNCNNPITTQQFERYFEANDVSKQGSFYLQSKIYRAHEMLMEFQAEKHKQDINGGK